MKIVYSTLSLGLTALGGLSLSLIPQNSALAGTLYFSLDGTSQLYTLDTSTGAATLIGTSGSTSSTVGLSPSGNDSILYGSVPEGLIEVNTDGTGTTTALGSTIIEGLAYDSDNDVLYGAGTGNGVLPPPIGTPQFFTVDPSDGSISDLPTLTGGVDIEGLAYGNGVVYALENGSNARLFSFDIDNETWSTIGTGTGIDFASAGLAYDSEENLLYAKGSQDTFLYSINLTTGVASEIGNTTLSGGGGLAFIPSDDPIMDIPEPSSLLGLLAIGGLGLISQLKKDSRN
jgi:hypothetical protein